VPVPLPPFPDRGRAWIAVHRFGLGPRPGEVEAARGDPEGWLLAQLRVRPGAPPLDRLPDHEALHAKVLRAGRAGLGDGVDRAGLREARRAAWRAEAEARARWAATTPAPFHERLVWCWSSRFTVSTARKSAMHLVGAFEREAVRPRVTGPLREMLRAAVRHPAMLLYLDNAGSIGPDTRAGQRRGRGLNENLAREVLELHTLGADGGYTQADVRGLAGLLTGWTVFGGPPLKEGRGPGFTFRADLHQPGPHVLLGARYGGGEAEGLRALDALAAHPATLRRAAEGLVMAFFGPRPDGGLVAAVEGRLRESDGDLGEAAAAMVRHPASWGPMAPGQGALRDPARFVAAAARGLGAAGGRAGRRGAARMVQAQASLGQPVFGAPSPEGWSVDPADWAGPEQVLRRVELALAIAEGAAGAVPDPLGWAEGVLGPAVDDALRAAIAGAPSRVEALATALASPAFQWT
jgi:uncharacterized protein (DUF1800 family)